MNKFARTTMIERQWHKFFHNRQPLYKGVRVSVTTRRNYVSPASEKFCSAHNSDMRMFHLHDHSHSGRVGTSPLQPHIKMHSRSANISTPFPIDTSREADSTMQPFHSHEAHPLPSPQLPPSAFRRRRPTPTHPVQQQRTRQNSGKCTRHDAYGPTLHHHSAIRGT